MIAVFFHLAGIILALGAVTVIDCLGFLSRKSISKFQVMIAAHHVTMPLIWLGLVFTVLSWVFLYTGSALDVVKTILLVALTLNGCFLSFVMSPRLDALAGTSRLLPAHLQRWSILSLLVSFTCWWSVVALTAFALS